MKKLHKIIMIALIMCVIPASLYAANSIPKAKTVSAICSSAESKAKNCIAINLSNISDETIVVHYQATENPNINGDFTLGPNVDFTDNVFLYINISENEITGDIKLTYIDPNTKSEDSLTVDQCYKKQPT